jgi:hypothetical protein
MMLTDRRTVYALQQPVLCIVEATWNPCMTTAATATQTGLPGDGVAAGPAHPAAGIEQDESASLIPLAQVRDVRRSMAFYGKLGFVEGNAPRGEFRVTDPDGYVLMITHT